MHTVHELSLIDPVKPLEEAKVHALSKVYCEIELYVAGLERAARQMQERGGTSVNVYGGEVGILQTGNFSSAFMTVTLDDISKREIVAALETVGKALSDIRKPPFHKEEVLAACRT